MSFVATILQNLAGSTKCSLLVAKDPEDRTDTVITVYGDATPVIPSCHLPHILVCLCPDKFLNLIFIKAYCICYLIIVCWLTS